MPAESNISNVSLYSILQQRPISKSAPDEQFRQIAVEIPDTTHCVPADTVILALGFDVTILPVLDTIGIETDRWGQILINPASGETSHKKVYSGGDCYRGADLVVTAAADGGKAALAIMRAFLG